MTLSLDPSARNWQAERGSAQRGSAERGTVERSIRPPTTTMSRFGGRDRAVSDFEVETVSCDQFRALVRLVGAVSDEAAVVLGRVLDDHQRAGRRYLRLDVRDVRTLSLDALDVVRRTHEALLERRGTLILTGVDARVGALLRRGDPDGRLFLVAPTAAELSPTG
jgi:anti-anti-sigma regulatory factor